MVRLIIVVTIVMFFLPVRQTMEPVQLNVMTFNIRYDNPDDGMNNWKFRKDVAAKAILENDVDVLGTQEVLVNQLNDLKDRLPEYNAVGVGREDGIHKGEHSAVFYKKDRFEEINSGNFWLSETPEIVSVGWDAALERIATWVVLKDKKSRKEFFFMNTHLDHIGKVARTESAKLLMDRAEKLGNGLPVIITGDFNSGPGSDVVQEMIRQGNHLHLSDSWSVAATVKGEESTFHNFSDSPDMKWSDRIDYIFVSDGIHVDSYTTLPKRLDGIFLSDHVPVLVVCDLNDSSR